MDQDNNGGARAGMPVDACIGQPSSAALAMEQATPVDASGGRGCSASAALDSTPQKSYLEGVATTFEPLKVCLDDDSSIEDEDEDMFDDDAFAFGDEDFQALMSHDVIKRMAASFNTSPSSTNSSSPATPVSAAQHSLLPHHRNAPHLPEKAAGEADSGVDSLPSTAPSSTASLGNLTLASHTSCSSSKKTKSKRRVSLHNDVVVVPIPTRSEYNLVRERIWSSATELYQNAARNTLEFASEGFNWRNAAEDEHFVRGPSGERIHPVHYMARPNLACNPLNCVQEKRRAEGDASPITMDAEPLAS